MIGSQRLQYLFFAPISLESFLVCSRHSVEGFWLFKQSKNYSPSVLTSGSSTGNWHQLSGSFEVNSSLHLDYFWLLVNNIQTTYWKGVELSFDSIKQWLILFSGICSPHLPPGRVGIQLITSRSLSFASCAQTLFHHAANMLALKRPSWLGWSTWRFILRQNSACY